jgi:hypothetical protein
METEILTIMSDIADELNNINNTLQIPSVFHWWDTQWFSGVIGAVTGLLGSYIFHGISARNKRLFDYYQWFLDQGTFSDPETLLRQAASTSYGIIDKPIAEKMVISLRSHIKYWYEPFGRFRYLMYRYENALWKIPNGRTEEIIKQTEFIEAQKRFVEVEEFVHRKTGENEWTS